MKILDPEQIRQVDEATIAAGIPSIDLMEKAATACAERITQLLPPAGRHMLAVCGRGNNGGDGLAITRLLIKKGYKAEAVLLAGSSDISPDAGKNASRLRGIDPALLTEIDDASRLGKKLTPGTVIIDALCGTGIHGPVSGLLKDVIDEINRSGLPVISIDVPSGLSCNEVTTGSVVHARITLTLHMPKLAFMLPENAAAVGNFQIVPIGLDEAAISSHSTNYHYVTHDVVRSLLQPRSKFDHKGTFGHAGLYAGSRGKSGAALLSARACLRSGAGLLTVHSTRDTLQAILCTLPEAMSDADENDDFISSSGETKKYTAIGFGPGVGIHIETASVLKKLLQYHPGSIVIDADGLNILSENKTWLEFLPSGCVLTPHPGEFERLAGKFDDDFARIQGLRQFAMRYECVVLLKGAHTAIALPEGSVFFNSTGNPALAKGGTGDVLTGVILGLITRGYTPGVAAIIGVYIHGLAADQLLATHNPDSVLAGEIADKIAGIMLEYPDLSGFPAF